MELHLRLPLAEACGVAGLPLATGKAILRRNPKLATAWRSNRRGRPTAIVNPAQLQDRAYQGRASVAARFAHRCRRAGVNPARALWTIVNGSRMPDGSFDLDMIGDSMRVALDDDAGGTLFLRGSFEASAFLAVLGGAKATPKQRPFDIQLADLLLRQSSRRGVRMPADDFAQLWKKLLAEVCKKPAWRRSKPVPIRCANEAGAASVRFAGVPLYERKLRGAGKFSGERRKGDRDIGAKEARNDGKANRRLAQMAAEEIARRIFPASGRANKAVGKSLDQAFRAMRSAHRQKGKWHPLPFEANAAAALEILRDDIGISREKAWPFLLTYWRREESDLLPPSASAVMAAFQLKSRARTKNGPRRKRKLNRQQATLRSKAGAEGLCDLFGDERLTKAQRGKVAQLAFHLMQLELAGRADSLDSLAQHMGFASAGAAFFRAFPQDLIDEAARCLDQCEAVPKLGRESAAADS